MNPLKQTQLPTPPLLLLSPIKASNRTPPPMPRLLPLSTTNPLHQSPLPQPHLPPLLPMKVLNQTQFPKPHLPALLPPVNPLNQTQQPLLLRYLPAPSLLTNCQLFLRNCRRPSLLWPIPSLPPPKPHLMSLPQPKPLPHSRQALVGSRWRTTWCAVRIG